MTRAIKVRHLVAALVTALALAPPAAVADTDPGPLPGADATSATDALLSGGLAADALALGALGADPLSSADPGVTSFAFGAAAAGGPGWTGTWEAAASGTVPGLPGASIRNVVHISVGGSALRVRISNRLGTAPLQLRSLTVALQAQGASAGPNAVAGSLRTATFDGATSVRIPAGKDLVTDPVRLAVPADTNLLISVHTRADSGPATYHRSALQANFLARKGDHTRDVDGAAYTVTVGNWYYVTGVDVLGPPSGGSVVALGDSLTDGSGSTFGANRRWPDRLADRLRGLPTRLRLGVLNAGIAGNRVLRDGVGPSALSRLDADVLSRTGVRAVIVMEGINDIKGTPEETDPEAFEDAFRRIVSRAHARGVRVIGATITPYGGHAAYTETREAVRLAVNAVIRGGDLFDEVVDFDAVVRDPARPHRILPVYDAGDHLHFNDAGMRALAEAIDPGSLRP